jgi:hypothetical protein
MRPPTTEGYHPQKCRLCGKTLLYGMFVGVARCSRCKADNRRTLDELQQFIDNLRQAESSCATPATGAFAR